MALLAASPLSVAEPQTAPSDGSADEASRPSPPATWQALDELLLEARQAFAAGQLEAVGARLELAEQSSVRYPRLHFGDTPAKLRRDYDAAVAKQNGGRPKFNPIAGLLKGGKPPVSDPFAKGSPGSDIGQQLVTGDNPFRGAAGSPEAQAGQPTNAPPSQREASDRALIGARQALTVGDRNRAQQYLALAQELGVAYDELGDSPTKIAYSIGELAEIEQLRESDDQAAWRQAYAKFLTIQADALVGWNDLETAGRAAEEAQAMSVEFTAGALTPADVLRRVAQLRKNAAESATMVAGAESPTSTPPAATDEEALVDLSSALIEDAEVTPAAAQLPAEASPALPETSISLAQAETSLPGADGEPGVGINLFADEGATELPAPETGQPSVANGSAAELLSQGETALRSGNRNEALGLFRQAYEQRTQLDLLSQQRLQSHLQMLSPAAPAVAAPRGDSDFLSAAGDSQAVLARQVFADVTKRQSEASRIRQSDPLRSQKILEEARTMVEQSGLDASAKAQLLSRVDLSLDATRKYIADHKAELDLDAANQAVLDDIDRQRAVKVQVQEEVAELVNEFNQLIDEHRDAEAEIVALKLKEIAPDELVVQQIWRQAKIIRRERQSAEINEKSEEGFARFLADSRDTAAEAALGMTRDIHYGSNWPAVKNRKALSDSQLQRTARELEIEKKLKMQVRPTYDEMPLAAVMDALGELSDVNIHLDPRGLNQEGVRSDTPVSLNLKGEISLKSALQLILEPLHLTYQIKDEVLKITSEQIRDGDLKRKVYNVADLVIPIPNFVPSSNIGLQGLIEDSYRSMGYGPGYHGPGPRAFVDNPLPGQYGGAVTDAVLANPAIGGPAGPGGTPFGVGPGGGPGGAAQADFDSLIDLIVSTVEHESWMENGTGEGEIQPFPTNLSLVISQTQRVHEQVADLLEQLRRLQDLQVTIEVRFIRLTDSFFERIGLDFDFNIEDGTGISTNPSNGDALVPGATYEPNRATAAVGITNPPSEAFFPNFTVDLDIPFRNNSFGLATPQFGTPQTVGTFGFSILSDIEAFFVIEASQGDQRANVLQAPKVTLFNGQQASVFDTAFVPFVISVIPVVGEFAAAQQPVIVVLSEGTQMTVQAVVSDDRRYVRLTLVPFFSQIGEVREFTFDGSETIQSSSGSTDGDDDGNDESNNNAQQVVRSGTTVQLPTFEVISVSTTVSVPDGGTVLLGGIKRLREGRNEFGVPLLSKIPYVDRLFRNVGIGRETDSLMMMVTPHIIIQEEEEERLGLTVP